MWWDGEILAGSDWQHAIAERLLSADVVVLLVSPAFLSSTYCYREEIRQAMERHDQNNALVIPVLIEACYWQSTPFAKLQGLPVGMVPIATFPKRKRSEIWANVAQAIHKSCEHWVERNEPPKTVPPISDTQIERNIPRIVLNSLQVVSEQEIYECFQKYDFNWPNIGVDWPQSSDIVLNNALKVISKFDGGTLEEVGRDYFVQHGPAAVARATNMRKAVASAVPDMVSRLNQFKRYDAIQGVRNFLLYSNYQIHKFLAYLSTWKGLAPLGLSLPPVWEPFTDLNLENALSKLFGEEPQRIYHARLLKISGSDKTRGGKYLDIYGPMMYLEHLRVTSSIHGQGIICSWLVPQVEFDMIRGSVDDPEYEGLVSSEYCSEWVFSKLYHRNKEIR